MKKLLHIFLTASMSVLVFHLTYKSMSFVSSNWIFGTASYPDQKSYLWTLQMGYMASLIYFVPTFLSGLILLRQRYSILTNRVSFLLYTSFSIVFGVLLGLVLSADFDYPVERWSFTLFVLSPLWIFIFQIGLLKVTHRVYT